MSSTVLYLRGHFQSCQTICDLQTQTDQNRPLNGANAKIQYFEVGKEAISPSCKSRLSLQAISIL